MRGKCGSTWNEGLRGFDMQKCDNSNATVIIKDGDSLLLI